MKRKIRSHYKCELCGNVWWERHKGPTTCPACKGHRFITWINYIQLRDENAWPGSEEYERLTKEETKT